MPDTPPGGAGFYRVNHDHLGTLCLGLGNEWPVVQVGADGITGPQNDVFGVFKTFGIGARRRANSHEVGSAGARVAEGALTDGCPQLVEEWVAHVQAIQNAFGPQVAIGENRRRPVGVDNPPPLPLDLVKGLLPGKTPKLSAALGAGPLQRVEHPLGAVHPVRIVVDLDTQSAARKRVLRVAAYVNGAPVLDGDQHGTGVRTIVRTRPNDRAGVLGVS